jgi:hypothetical protein
VHVERVHLAFVVDAAVADREHLALHRLLLGGVGDDQTPLGLRFLVDAFHEDPVVQRSYLHRAISWLVTRLVGSIVIPSWSFCSLYMNREIYQAMAQYA